MVQMCKYCGSDKHTSIWCFKKPRKPIKKGQAIKKFGKKSAEWLEARNSWLQANPKNWRCHYCDKELTIETLTLDHKEPRGSNPNLRTDLNNLVPCCYFDNSRKGSISYDKYIAKYYPYKADV